MIRRVVCCVCWSLLLVVARPVESAEPAAPAGVRLLVPAYFYPAERGLADWTRLLEAASRTPIVAVVNPDSGPGKRADENYRELFRRAAKTPATLIGYVTLSYAQRPLSAVKADIDSWLHFYPDVQGIFFDEQPSGAEHAAFARECFAYARQRLGAGALFTNPGVPCAREYLAGQDGPAACLFEHEKDFDKFKMPDWARNLPRERLVVLLYGQAPVQRMRQDFEASLSLGFGCVYITDRALPNPWDGLPAYFDDLVELAAKSPPIRPGEKK